MKFNIIISLLCIALLLGCTQLNPFEITDSNKPQNLEKNPVLAKDSVQVHDNGNVRTFTVYAQKIEGEWRFPLMNYSGEFVIGFNLSKNEQVYLTPYVKKGKGIIFNAILEQQVFACDSESVVVLGHETPVDDTLEPLRGDDRWQVQTDCNEPMHDLTSVTMNGYFSDLKDNEQISLFGNDNTVLVWFEDLETQPVLKVVYTKPLGVKETAPLRYTNTIEKNFSLEDYDAGISYPYTETENAQKASITFEPPLPEYSGEYDENLYYGNEYYRTDLHNVDLILANQTWKVIYLNPPNETQNGRIVLGREETGGIYNVYETFSFANHTLYFDYDHKDTTYEIVIKFCDIQVYDHPCTDDEKIHIPMYLLTKLDNEYDIMVRGFAGGYTYGASWIDFSVFSEVIELNESNAILKWKNGALQSIALDKNTQTYEHLAAPARPKKEVALVNRTLVGDYKDLLVATIKNDGKEIQYSFNPSLSKYLYSYSNDCTINGLRDSIWFENSKEWHFADINSNEKKIVFGVYNASTAISWASQTNPAEFPELNLRFYNGKMIDLSTNKSVVLEKKDLQIFPIHDKLLYIYGKRSYDVFEPTYAVAFSELVELNDSNGEVSFGKDECGNDGIKEITFPKNSTAYHELFER